MRLSGLHGRSGSGAVITAAPISAAVPPAAPSVALGGGLVGRAAPPLWLPAEHFAAALLFWLLGSGGLVLVAPEIARGGFPLPRVAAVTHLFTLGWITTSIIGALYQFLPVALGVPIRSERVAHVGFLLYLPGLLLFLGGLVTGATAVMVAGAALFGSALLLFVGNLAATLRRATERNLTWWSLAFAAFFLACTIVLGVSLAGNLRWGYLGADRFLAVGVHLHVAIAGWVMLVIVGVAHRLLPMFLLSHGASTIPGRVALGGLAGGVALLLAVHHARTPTLDRVVAALLAGGVIAFLLQAYLFFRHRRKPSLDPGLRLAGAGLGTLIVVLLLAPLFLEQGISAPRVVTAYGVALVGAPTLFVAGHYYKILPFLIWFHRYGPLVGTRKVPKVAELYASMPGNVAAALLPIGVLGLVIATITGSTTVGRLAAGLFACGAIVVATQMFILFRGET